MYFQSQLPNLRVRLLKCLFRRSVTGPMVKGRGGILRRLLAPLDDPVGKHGKLYGELNHVLATARGQRNLGLALQEMAASGSSRGLLQVLLR